MKYNVEFIEQKSPDWKIVQLRDGAGTLTDNVSVNRVNKKGETFPNFDGITLEADVEGELWTSTTGKHYLFAPKIGKVGGGGGKNVERLMDKKASTIEHFQASKENSIILAGTARDATLLTVEWATQCREINKKIITSGQMKEKWLDFRKFLQENHEGSPF